MTIKKVVDSVVKKQFRTMYDTKGYNDAASVGGKCITDPSGYTPIEALLERFGQGKIVPGLTTTAVPHTDSEDDKLFAEFDHAQKLYDDIKLRGEAALEDELRRLRQKISAEKTAKQTSVVPPQSVSATSSVQK